MNAQNWLDTRDLEEKDGLSDRSAHSVEDQELAIAPEEYGPLTDLYQLTMTACYVGEGLDTQRASFELFTRRLPENFGYLIAMGLAQALDYLEKFRFSPAQIQALQATHLFDRAPEQFWHLLANARFTGDVWAVPEGTAIFANEPLLRVEAPLWQAQIVETYLLNTLNYQTLIATRAARMRDVAGAQATLLEFGTRRAFSPQASLWAARATLAAGFNATSNVLAALKLGRKPSGTMAHSLVMALAATEGSEAEAFTAFHRYFPGAPLLIDTYDPIAAARHLATQVQNGLHLSGIRIDSGDLVSLSKQVRALLPGVPIFASGDLDEYKIAELQAAGAAIDGYGLGTQLVTGSPVNGVYKLVEINDIPVMKKSTGKATYPGRKQIVRCYENGIVRGDRLKLEEEGVGIRSQESGVRSQESELIQDAKFNGEARGARREAPEETDSRDTSHEPRATLSIQNPKSKIQNSSLLQLVMKQGQRLYSPESLETIAQRTAHSVASLPAATRQILHPQSISVELSPALLALIAETDR